MGAVGQKRLGMLDGKPQDVFQVGYSTVPGSLWDGYGKDERQG